MLLFGPDEEFPTWACTAPPQQAETAATEVVQWLADVLPRDVLERLPAAITQHQGPRAIPRRADLTAVLDWWNGLHADGLVPHAVKSARPSAEILKAWILWCRNPDLQQQWQDLAAVEEQIAASPFCREGWFRLEKLLGGRTNKDGCPIIQKLLDGGYRDGQSQDEAATDPFGEFVRRNQ